MTPDPIRELGLQLEGAGLQSKENRGSYLRGDVIWSPTEGPGRDPVHHVLLAHPKVGDLDVSFRIQHDVIELQVPVRKRDGISVLPRIGDGLLRS